MMIGPGQVILAFVLGFCVGFAATLGGVVVFWSFENRRYRRRYKRPDEHATHYKYYGNEVPRERKGG